MKTCNMCGLEKSREEFYSGHGKCKHCYKVTKAPYIETNKENLKEAMRKCYRANPSAYKQRNDIWKIHNEEKHKAYKAKHNREYFQAHKAESNARCRMYEAAKLQRTPSWLTVQEKEEIKEFYIIAHELSWLCEGGLNVDHIVPLRGKNVSGLHVPWNLQVIPEKENFKKRNKF